MKVIVNGRTLSESESKRHTRKRVALHGGIPAILQSGGRFMHLETDTSMFAQHNAMIPEDERRQIALAARRAGRSEQQVYDPTLAEIPLDPTAMFESRDAAKKLAAEKRVSRDEYFKPKYRLHPRLVQETYERMVEIDPDVLRRDRREVCEGIIERHGSKG